MPNKKPKQELYLKIPYHILNLQGIGLCEKVLLAHIHSFGIKGCWEGNETIGKMFFVKSRTVSRWVANLKRAGHILWVHPKGRYRTIWAKSHLEVKAAETLLYMGEKISKKAVISCHAGRILLRQNCSGGIDKNGVSTSPNCVFQVRQKCPHTKNTTIISTTGNTIATPSPSPAGGRAPASLEERREQQQAQLAKFTSALGKSTVRAAPLMPDEFENRRTAALKALRGISAENFT